MARVVLIQDHLPVEIEYEGVQGRSPLALSDGTQELLYIEARAHNGVLAREVCRRRGYNVRVASNPDQACKIFRRYPIGLVICDYSMAASCIDRIRELQNGDRAQVFLTVSGDLNSLRFRRAMHRYSAVSLLSWPLSIIDLIDLIEKNGYLSRQKVQRPSMLCMENARYLMSRWIERKTGTVREGTDKEVFVTLLNGELVERKGGTIYDICSAGKLRFYDGEITGQPCPGALATELLELARYFNTDRIFQYSSDRLLIPDLRSVGLPLSPCTRRFLTERHNGILLSHFSEMTIENIGLIRSEFALLKLLGLITVTKPTKSNIDFGPLRHQVLRRLSLLSQNNVAQALGLPHTADIVELQRACQRLLHRIGGWLNHSALPPDIHDNMRLLRQQLRQQVLHKQPGRTHDRIHHMLSKANEHVNGKNWVKASETLELLLEIDPSHAQAQSLLGWTWFNGSKQPKVLQKARILLERSIKLNNQDAVSHYHLACLLKEIGDQEGARTAGRRAIQLRPWETSYLSLLEELEDEPQQAPA